MKKRLVLLLCAFSVLGFISSMGYSPNAFATVPGINTLVSFNSTNTGPSLSADDHPVAVSEDGNIVAFYSSASDLISGVTGTHLFMRNISASTTSLIDVSTTGTPAGVSSPAANYFAMSRTGRYVAFVSGATNVVSSPTVPSGSLGHVFVRDTLLGANTLVDTSASGAIGNSGGNTAAPKVTGVSDDGRFVAFSAQSTNLLPSDNPTTPNYAEYPYVKDMLTGNVIMLLTSNTGVHGNLGSTGTIVPSFSSCDGAFYVFSSNLTTLTPNDNGNTNTYLVDIRNGFHITNVTYNLNNGGATAGISCNGRYVLLSTKDTGLTTDTVDGNIKHLFRYDLITDSYKLIDISSSGYISSTYGASNGQGSTLAGRNVSDNGLVVFTDYDLNLVSPASSNHYSVYIRDPEAGTTELVAHNSSGIRESPGFSHSRTGLTISADGKSVVYSSPATNLIPGISGGASPDGNIVRSEIQ